MLIIFRDMTADMFNNKKRNLILTEFFIKGRKHVSLIFITAILFRCFEKYQTKFNMLLCYENSKQRRTLTNRI